MIIPSAIAVKDHIGKIPPGKISDLDFYIGDEALSPAAANYSVKVKLIQNHHILFLFSIQSGMVLLKIGI